jgi:hypothetical protein
VKRLAVLVIERGQKLVLELLRERAQALQITPSGSGDADHVAAAVARSASATAMVPWVCRAPSARMARTLYWWRSNPSRPSRSTIFVLNASPSRASRKPLLAASSLATGGAGDGAPAMVPVTGISVLRNRWDQLSWQPSTISRIGAGGARSR